MSLSSLLGKNIKIKKGKVISRVWEEYGVDKGSLTASQDGRKSREANCMEMSSRLVPPNDTKPKNIKCQKGKWEDIHYTYPTITFISCCFLNRVVCPKFLHLLVKLKY